MHCARAVSPARVFVYERFCFANCYVPSTPPAMQAAPAAAAANAGVQGFRVLVYRRT
jgi:hypothetical protein